MIRIKHAGDKVTTYAHLSEIETGLKNETKVSTGEKIGKVGSSGRSKGNHLHFELENPDQTPIDPSQYMRKEVTASEESETGTGGPELPSPDYSNMTGFIHTDGPKTTNRMMKDAEALNLQREMAHKEKMTEFKKINSTLKQSLDVQVATMEYLDLIYKGMGEIKVNVATQPVEDTVPEDSVVSIKLPTVEPSVSPKLSLKRKKYNV